MDKGGCSVGRKKEPKGGCKVGKKKKFNVVKKVGSVAKPKKDEKIEKKKKIKFNVKKTTMPKTSTPTKAPEKKKKIKFNVKKLPEFLGHVGSPHATNADRWYLENEEKPRIKKIYVEFIDESMVKQGLKPKAKDFKYSMKEYNIASDYADKKMRKWIKNNISLKL